MPPLRILTDTQIQTLLTTQTKPEINSFQTILKSALKTYSTTTERNHQPPPASTTRPEGQKCLFRTFTSKDAVGAKIIVQPVSGALRGMISLCDADGAPAGILNAADVTGYRTALCALIPYSWRRYMAKIVVFGAGTQALWHLRLALALRGDEIVSVVVVNRTVARAEALVDTLRGENSRWASVGMECLDPTRADYEEALKAHLATADAVFCTSAATAPVFPVRFLGLDQRVRMPYISAVGSWQPDMIELDPELIAHVARQISPGSKAGCLLVDDRDAVLHDTGEAVRSGIRADAVVEIGEVLDRDGDLRQWMEDGLLVYKSVGVGMMDLAASSAILGIARERGIGTVVPEF